MQPDAAMRRRSAEPRQFIDAVNGEAAIKKIACGIGELQYFRENQRRAIDCGWKTPLGVP
jgi:hypothetical protein